MSRVGKQPITVPAGVEVTLGSEAISVKGKLGTLSQRLHPKVLVKKEASTLSFEVTDSSAEANAMSGTMRALVANMVQGVDKGFEKKLTLVGVGYRAAAQGDVVNLQVGYSHPVNHKMPAGVKVATPTQTEIIVSGADRQKVGQIAAEIRAYKPPEPYKGKGIRYVDEVVVIKETKKK
jgi:large subunit ribosomal protein L6